MRASPPEPGDSGMRILTIILFVSVLTVVQLCGQTGDSLPAARHKLDFLPILVYDSDAGVGYGVKSFFLNYLDRDESFDVVLFNSSKGERWYKIVFSIPDFERREGKIYPLALDCIVEYDKWINYSFFGVVTTSAYNHQESYTREPLEYSLNLSRGFTSLFIGRIGLKYAVIRNFDFQQRGTLQHLPPGLNSGTVRKLSLAANLRYDSRNSFINPSRGIVLEEEMESVPGWDMNNVRFTRYSLAFQSYLPTPLENSTLALRGWFQALDGENLPVQVLLPIGGGSTLRGEPQDRYLDKVSAVVNLEARFPVYWRFGGIAGYDFGRVWHNVRELNLYQWSLNPTLGVRFYFDTFIVRLDVGFGRDETGFYLNFGQMF